MINSPVVALETALNQWRAVAAVLVGSVIALVEGRAWAPTVAGSAAIVLVGPTVIASARQPHIRDVVVDMLLGGSEELLAIAAVQRQRRRLSCRRTRVRLVRNLEEIIEQATSHRKLQVRLVRPLFERRVVASVADRPSTDNRAPARRRRHRAGRGWLRARDRATGRPPRARPQ